MAEEATTPLPKSGMKKTTLSKFLKEYLSGLDKEVLVKLAVARYTTQLTYENTEQVYAGWQSKAFKMGYILENDIRRTSD